MQQQTTPAIILRRTNYGEADRIITFLTPTGKVRAIVKGVRRSKSKLAGGIELFSESKITFMNTRGELARIISSRLETHWDNFLGDLQRMMFAYEAMKQIDKTVEDEAEADYFQTLKGALQTLNDLDVSLASVEVWFTIRLLSLKGHSPNLLTDNLGDKLMINELYTFSIDDMCFVKSSRGEFRSDHIKLLRLCQNHQPGVLKQIKNGEELAKKITPLMKRLLNTNN